MLRHSFGPTPATDCKSLGAALRTAWGLPKRSSRRRRVNGPTPGIIESCKKAALGCASALSKCAGSIGILGWDNLRIVVSSRDFQQGGAEVLRLPHIRCYP